MRGNQPLYGGKSAWFRYWKSYGYQVEITLQTVAFWQWILESEKYVTGSLVPVAIYTICQSFLHLQVIASVGSDPVVKKLTRILLNDFDRRYHPTVEGQLIHSKDIGLGYGNCYAAIHPYFFRASFLDPHTHHYLKKILTVENLNQVLWSLIKQCIIITKHLFTLSLQHCFHPTYS